MSKPLSLRIPLLEETSTEFVGCFVIKSLTKQGEVPNKNGVSVHVNVGNVGKTIMIINDMVNGNIMINKHRFNVVETMS